MYVELIRSFAKILDLMSKGCRKMVMRDADKQHLIHLDDLLNVKGYVYGIITANKILYCFKR